MLITRGLASNLLVTIGYGQKQTTQDAEYPIFVGGVGGQFTWRQSHSFQSIKPSKPIVIDTSQAEADDEEAVMVFVLSELISRGII